jgi:hypothetical protein
MSLGVEVLEWHKKDAAGQIVCQHVLHSDKKDLHWHLLPTYHA